MLISKADRNLLKNHDVKIDVNADDQCGLITIQDQQYKVTLLTLTQSDKPTWETKELDKKHMKNTAKKVAVMLLKKELLQQSTIPSEFSIHNKGITTYSSDHEVTVNHYNKEINKNTRPDYDALIAYLSSCICDTLDDTTEKSIADLGNCGEGEDFEVDDYLNRDNIEDEEEQQSHNSHVPAPLLTTTVTPSAVYSAQSSPAKKPMKIKKTLIRKKPLFKAQKRVVQKKNSEKQDDLALTTVINKTSTLKEKEFANNLIKEYEKRTKDEQTAAMMSLIPKIEVKSYTSPKTYPTVPKFKHSSTPLSQHAGKFPPNARSVPLKLLLTAVKRA